MKKKGPFKIPTILALPIMFVTFVGIALLIKYLQGYTIKVGEGVTAQDIRITNITDSSFTVSWLTNAKTSGFLVWGKENTLENVTGNNPPTFEMVHFITINNLSPDTMYSFKIVSGDIEFDSAGKSWEVKTAPPLPPPKHTEIISGSVINENGAPVSKALVLLSGENISPLSTITTDNGNWFIPLSISRKQDLLSYFDIGSRRTLEVFVHTGSDGIASAVFYTGNANPIPPIVIGKAQDFRDKSTSPTLEITRAKIDLSKNETQPSGFSVENSDNEIETLEIPESTSTPTTEPVFEKLTTSNNSYSLITPSKTDSSSKNKTLSDLTPVFVAPIMGVGLFLIGVYVGRKIRE